MDTVELRTARQLARMINDEQHPSAQREAIAKCAQCLFEVDAGTLQMSAEARAELEGGC